MRCPICKAELKSERMESRPFCSPRCKSIDLGQWLSEAYRVPIASMEEDENGTSEDGNVPQAIDEA